MVTDLDLIYQVEPYMYIKVICMKVVRPCLSWPWRRPISLTLRMTCMLTLQMTYILDLADDLYPWTCRWPISLNLQMTYILDLTDDLYPWPCRWPQSLTLKLTFNMTYILDLAGKLPTDYPLYYYHAFYVNISGLSHNRIQSPALRHMVYSVNAEITYSELKTRVC
jgi:hypothetical protein